MRWFAIVAISLSSGFSIDAEEVALAVDVERKLLSVELESYFAAYEDCVGNLRRLESDIAQADSEQSRTLLGERRDKLRSHLDALAVRARETAARIRAMDGERTKKMKLPDGTRVHLRDRVEPTGDHLDIAIEGRGFFCVFDPSVGQLLYTRIGDLDIDKEGNLVIGGSHLGLKLLPSIQIPDDAMQVVISDEGIVLAKFPGMTEMREVGRLRLSLFANPRGLSEAGENLFSPSETSGPARTAVPGKDGAGVIRQGNLEVSDSDRVLQLIGQLANLLAAQFPAE